MSRTTAIPNARRRTPVVLATLLLPVAVNFASAQVGTELPHPPTTTPVDRPADASSAGGAGERVVARRATLADPGRAATNLPPPQLPVQQHPWARFRPGAWRRVRIITESFDANGRFLGRSATSQTETLASVGPAGYSLEVVSLVEVGGKRLRGASQTVDYSLLSDEPGGKGLRARRLDSANLSLDGAVAPVERWSLVHGDAEAGRIETVCYSPDRSPFILRRESRPAEGDSGPVTTMTVTRVDAPLVLDGGIVPASHAVVTTRGDAVQEDRFEVRCDAVPGGLVSASSTERDASGRRVRWSTTELEDFGDSPPAAESGNRWRPLHTLRRLRKADRGRPLDAGDGASGRGRPR